MSQTAINKAGQPVAIAGLLSDNGEGVDIVSRFNNASAEIPFGSGVKLGTEKHGVILPSAATDVVQGIVVWSRNHQPGTNGDLGTTGLKQNAGLQLIRKGRIWVPIDAGVSSITIGSRGWCRAVSDGSGNTVLGRWAAAQDSTNNIDCTKQCVFVSALQLAADGTKIAELEVDFTNKP